MTHAALLGCHLPPTVAGAVTSSFSAFSIVVLAPRFFASLPYKANVRQRHPLSTPGLHEHRQDDGQGRRGCLAGWVAVLRLPVAPPVLLGHGMGHRGVAVVFDAKKTRSEDR